MSNLPVNLLFRAGGMAFNGRFTAERRVEGVCFGADSYKATCRRSAASMKRRFGIPVGLLIGGALALAAVWWLDRRKPAALPEPISMTRGADSGGNRISPELMARLSQLEAREREWNRTIWAQEIIGQDCGRVFDDLWDAINASTNKLAVVAAFPVGEVMLGRWGDPEQFRHGIERRASAGPGPVLGQEEWRQFADGIQTAGWELGEVELRHNRFELDADAQPARSTVYVAAQLTRRDQETRAILEGELLVEWKPVSERLEPAVVRRIDASRLELRTRAGAVPFRETVVDRIDPPRHALSIDPLLVYDLNGNGRMEIILAGRNRVYRMNDADDWVGAALCRHPPDVIYTAVLADFDGDGTVDLACATLQGLVLFRGSPEGTFDEPGEPVFAGGVDWRYPMVLTCGDVNGNGHLDLFVGQYKVPYEIGSMPTPYYDANDGEPAYLLLNDGSGRFTDATAAAGLAAKRWRRTYSASLVDLDGDGRLDLVVISDFAGVDLYRNNGQGSFMDVTRNAIPVAYAFGMAHALADFNADGRLDLLMIGMTSATVDRLEHLDLWHPDEPRGPERSAMMYGNRLYLGAADGGYRQGALGDSISRSGWSWGCGVLDLDNDGYPDVYIANGLESRDSVRDYEAEYWLHDRFVGASEEDPAVYLYFKSKFSRTRARGESYGGYDRNRLYWNQSAAAFLEIGHLMGVGFQEDARNVVTADLDGDGRVDLIVTSFEPWPDSSQQLRILMNRIEHSGNWIGFRFHQEASDPSPIGARVRLLSNGRTVVGTVVTGDSFRSQHPAIVHFGVGDRDRVESVEVQWPNGRILRLQEPALNRYHSVRAPAEGWKKPDDIN
jgi:enediyne biosynthesis protein E4